MSWRLALLLALAPSCASSPDVPADTASEIAARVPDASEDLGSADVEDVASDAAAPEDAFDVAHEDAIDAGEEIADVPPDLAPEIEDIEDTLPVPDEPEPDVPETEEPGDVLEDVPPDVEPEDVAEPGVECTDDVGEPDATGICPAWAPSGVLKDEFPVKIGRLNAAGVFEDIEQGEIAEIVQGPQGGIHFEIAFQVDLPDELQKCSQFQPDDPLSCTGKLRVEAWSFQPSCDGPQVGSYYSKVYLAYTKAPDPDVLTSGVVPIVFFAKPTEVAQHANMGCCVVIAVGVYKPLGTSFEKEPTVWGTAQHSLFCVDYF